MRPETVVVARLLDFDILLTSSDPVCFCRPPRLLLPSFQLGRQSEMSYVRFKQCYWVRCGLARDVSSFWRNVVNSRNGLLADAAELGGIKERWSPASLCHVIATAGFLSWCRTPAAILFLLPPAAFQSVLLVVVAWCGTRKEDVSPPSDNEPSTTRRPSVSYMSEICRIRGIQGRRAGRRCVLCDFRRKKRRSSAAGAKRRRLERIIARQRSSSTRHDVSCSFVTAHRQRGKIVCMLVSLKGTFHELEVEVY